MVTNINSAANASAVGFVCIYGLDGMFTSVTCAAANWSFAAGDRNCPVGSAMPGANRTMNAAITETPNDDIAQAGRCGAMGGPRAGGNDNQSFFLQNR
eukprot:CAMPEP_0179303120 /NCGR_PEP_ID=MMETSP0797-20121207/48416_1 /TAXON_ID=47934 /ORGANISM="Dinophysis acuminata, Strain DAEP01" /LENGTH=97 /DNA_ID=CAMNT_0021012671 /DNA_START=124 /DNA_END=413 /DNA_ORIENTATION=+